MIQKMKNASNERITGIAGFSVNSYRTPYRKIQYEKVVLPVTTRFTRYKVDSSAGVIKGAFRAVAEFIHSRYEKRHRQSKRQTGRVGQPVGSRQVACQSGLDGPESTNGR